MLRQFICSISLLMLFACTSFAQHDAPTLKFDGRDLAAERIDFSLVPKTSPFNGRVRIVGVVKNVGTATWFNPKYGVEVRLMEDNRVVALRFFHRLAPGQVITLRYERNWSSTSPSEGEFPPNYKLAIPEVDLKPKNNVRVRTGADINSLF